jgi:hypothetical protein
MARIKFTAIVESIQGTIGGTTFQRNAYGYTVKSKPNMINPWTIAQQAQKNLMSFTSQQWRTLTDSERSIWNAWAEANPTPSRLNPESYLNGYNLFIKYQRFRSISDGGVNASPSFTLDGVGGLNIQLRRVGSTFILEYEAPGLEGDWNILVYNTSPIPLGREFVNTTPRFITFAGSTSADTIDLTAGYQNAFGFLPSVGNWIGTRIILVNQVSAQIANFPITQYEVGS